MTTKTRKWPLLLRIVSARPRLFLSILAGFAVGALLPLYVTEGGFAILVLTIVSACASVGAVFAWLEIATRAETFAFPGLAFLLLTIMLSWAFIQTMFALHYAHEFYAEHDHSKKGGGLIFPHDPEPTYWDFVYLAFSIGTATQVSDVEISSKRIRRTVTLHGIVSFFFNVMVIALTVGLVGDAIQN